MSTFCDVDALSYSKNLGFPACEIISFTLSWYLREFDEKLLLRIRGGKVTERNSICPILGCRCEVKSDLAHGFKVFALH